MYNYNKIQRLWTQKKKNEPKLKKKKDHKKEKPNKQNKP